jgi:hypothetical protein
MHLRPHGPFTTELYSPLPDLQAVLLAGFRDHEFGMVRPPSTVTLNLDFLGLSAKCVGEA